MSLQVHSALLLVLCACSTTVPKQQNQVAIPWAAPLVAPKPVAVPAPAGLTPPMTVMVDPNARKMQDSETKHEGSGSNRSPPAPLTAAPRKQVPELQHEREIARTCGFDFRIGVRSAAHKRALEAVDLTLKVVVMDWC